MTTHTRQYQQALEIMMARPRVRLGDWSTVNPALNVTAVVARAFDAAIGSNTTIDRFARLSEPFCSSNSYAFTRVVSQARRGLVDVQKSVVAAVARTASGAEPCDDESLTLQVAVDVIGRVDAIQHVAHAHDINLRYVVLNAMFPARVVGFNWYAMGHLDHAPARLFDTAVAEAFDGAPIMDACTLNTIAERPDTESPHVAMLALYNLYACAVRTYLAFGAQLVLHGDIVDRQNGQIAPPSHGRAWARSVRAATYIHLELLRHGLDTSTILTAAKARANRA